MCSQLSGDVWASHASGTDCSVARRWTMASAMSVEFQNTIAAMTRLRPEARNGCASALRSAIRPCLPALFEGADDLREEMTLRALVEPGMAASAQFRAFEPVEHEQRAFDPPQLLECEVELVLAAVGREFSQHDGRRHDAGLQRRAPYQCGRCGCCGSAGTAALARRRRGQPHRGRRRCAPTPPTEPSAGVERWIGSIKLYRLWLKRRSSCLSPSLGAYGLQDAPPRSGQPNTTS